MNRLTLIIGLALASGHAFPHGYTIRDLGELRNGNASYADAINNRGDVAGASYRVYMNDGSTTNAPSPYLYDDRLIDLGSFGSAVGINDSKQVVGDVIPTLEGVLRHAFIYDGKMHDLGMLPGDDESLATAINNAGDIVGYSYAETAPTHAFLYRHGALHSLGTLRGDTDSLATSINGQGHIVGQSSRTLQSGNNQIVLGHAFLYDGVMHDLGTLPGDNVSAAAGINESGKVIGSSNRVTFDRYSPAHAFLYDGTMRDLGTLGGETSYAEGINKHGVIVGMSDTAKTAAAGNVGDAFVYKDGKMFDLNNLINISRTGWLQLIEATAINDLGQIVGWGINPNGGGAFRLTPVPVAFELLLQAVSGVAPAADLALEIKTATAFYDAHDIDAACAMLTGFSDEVRSLKGTKIDTSLDSRLLADSKELKIAIGCN